MLDSTPASMPTPSITFGQLADLWWAEHAPRLVEHNMRDTARILLRNLPSEFFDTPADSITRRQVHTILTEVGKTRYGIRRALHADLRRIYRWGMAELHCETDPTAGLRTRPSPARTRVLDDNELQLIWHAVGRYGEYGRIARLIMLTGCRRSEIGDLSWPEVQLGRKGGPALVIPANRMKARVEHVVPLAPLAVLQLPEPKLGREWLFGTTAKGFQNWKIKSDTVDRDLIGMAPWGLHDLRRTFRTRLSAMGVDFAVAEAAIAHKPSGVHAIYDRYRWEPELRAALELWAGELARIAGLEG